MIIPAIPTTYSGVRFRSRLEARWAAFFDLCEWPWEYEPLDLDGYIPDFVLRFKRPILVEVKPLLWSDEEHERWGYYHARTKTEASGWRGEALILGSAFPMTMGFGSGVIGRLAERDPEIWWWEDALAFTCKFCRRPSIAHDGGSYRCRVSDCYDGREHVDNEFDFVDAFRRAGSMCQWRAA